MNRRQFFATLFATLFATPLARLGWRKPPKAIEEPLGITIRMVSGPDGAYRMDVLYGFTLRPEMSCRILG